MVFDVVDILFVVLSKYLLLKLVEIPFVKICRNTFCPLSKYLLSRCRNTFCYLSKYLLNVVEIPFVRQSLVSKSTAIYQIFLSWSPPPRPIYEKIPLWGIWGLDHMAPKSCFEVKIVADVARYQQKPCKTTKTLSIGANVRVKLRKISNQHVGTMRT